MTDEYTVQDRKETPGWLMAAVILLAIVSIAGFGLAWRNQTRLQQMGQDYTAQFKTAEQEHAQYTENVNALEQRLAKANEETTAMHSDMDVVTRRLKVTQSDLTKARAEAAQIREEGSKQLEEMGTAVKTELATKATSEQLNTVSGDVTAVKSDLDVAKNDLRMTRSELGTLIARNGEQIDVLRRMGERDYVEFTIQGKKKPQVVGPLTVELRSVDTKKNKFTVALVVDDVRTEKKDRLVNEPIFFYPRGVKSQATEFVVNTVGKDKITGYVSIPKRAPAGSTTAASAQN
jgi:septal ring factor EnvC (AmiA/AmiB activator)